MPAEIIENPRWRNKKFIYEDRREAGRILSGYLSPYGGQQPIILAIPAGGVAVGVEAARALGFDFDVLCIRKIPIPGQTEAGFGAVSLEGDEVIDPQLSQLLRLDGDSIAELKKPVVRELQARNMLFRGSRPFPDLEGRTAILVDDGLASGYTMSVAAAVARRKKPAGVIIAAPTAPQVTVDLLADAADAVVCPNIREGMRFAVADAYRRWHDLGNDEVLLLLRGTAPQA